MDQKDLSRFRMWKAVSAFLNEHEVVWVENIPFADARMALQNCIDDAEAAQADRAEREATVMKDREELRQAAINRVTAIAKSAKAYAIDSRNDALLVKVHASKGTLLHLAESELTCQLLQIVESAGLYAMQLLDYGVHPNDLQTASEAIYAYVHLAQTPDGEILDIKAIRSRIPAIMMRGRAALDRLDNLVHIFERANQFFVPGYKRARVTVDVMNAMTAA